MDAQVVVVGAGPVGLALATELGLRGVDVTVLERRPAPHDESRASTLHARTMELLDQRGLLAELGSPASSRTGHFGGLPLDLTTEPTRFPGQWKVPQTAVERVLAVRAGRLAVPVRRAHEVVRVMDTGTEVVVGFDGPDGPGAMTAQYVVGCDGVDSAVRRLAGFELAGRPATRALMRADVTGISVRDRRFERLPAGLAIAARGSNGVTRVMVHELGRAQAIGADFADVVAAWARVTGEDISAGTPIWVNAFDDASRQVTSYRNGRVLLAGDAAHQQMPIGGQALNLGLQDAFNLGWKLAAEVTGRAPAGLLDTYSAERHAVGRQVLTNIEAQALLLLGGAEVEPARAVLGELLAHPPVQRHLAGTVTGLGLRYAGADDPLVGRPAPHLDLKLTTGPTSTTELLRPGRGLVLDLSQDERRSRWLVRTVRSCTAGTAVASAQARPDDAAPLPDTVVIRPDGYVAWTGARTDDPRPALHRWLPAATPRTAPIPSTHRTTHHRSATPATDDEE